MFLKILTLVAIIAIVWFGFRTFERMNRVEDGRRRTGERSFGERLRKSIREKRDAPPPPDAVEDTEKCPTCGAFVSVTGIRNCGRENCPY